MQQNINDPLLVETEDQFQAVIIGLARYSGWLVYHTRDSRRSAKGFPDLVLVRPPRVIFAELKREGADPTPEQEVWLSLLRACPGTVETYLWRPSMWEEVREILAKGRGNHRST